MVFSVVGSQPFFPTVQHGGKAFIYVYRGICMRVCAVLDQL